MKNFITGKTLAPMTNYPRHVHEGWEIIINISGEGYNVLENETYPFFPGSIICVPPKMFHEKRANLKFEDLYITTTDPHCFYGNKALTAKDDEFKSLENIFRLIYYYYYRDEQKISSATESLFQALIQLLYDRFQMKHMNPYVLEVQRRIIENFTDPEFTMLDTMAQLPICEDYLRKLFKKELEVTPHEYLIKLRIDHAKGLLSTHSYDTISQIALASGFYDMHYFSRVFKKLTGVAPNQYNKSSELST